MSAGKVGLDDFLAAGGTVEELFALAEDDVRPDPVDDTPAEDPGADPFEGMDAGGDGGEASAARAGPAPPGGSRAERRQARAARLSEAVAILRALPAHARLSAAEEDAAGEARAVWLDRYVAVSQSLAARAPARYHTLAGLGSLCLAIARRAGFRVNPVKVVYPTLMAVACARSTVYGKTDAQKVAQALLQEAGIADVLLPRQFTAPAALAALAIQVPTHVRDGGKKLQARWLARHRHAGQRGIIRDELHSLFTEAAEERGSGLLDLVLIADDAPAVMDGGLTLMRGETAATDVSLTILGATTPAMLRSAARAPQLWQSGVFGRLLVLGPGAPPCYGGRPDVDEGAFAALVADLRTIHAALGVPHLEFETDAVSRTNRDGDQVEVERIIGAVQRGYEPRDVVFSAEAWRRCDDYSRGLFELLLRPGFPDRLSPTYGRLPELAQRAAIALAVGEHCLRGGTGTIRVGLGHWCAAQQLAEDWRAGVHEALAEIVSDPESAELEEAADAAEAIARARARRLIGAALVPFRAARAAGQEDPGLSRRECSAALSRNVTADELAQLLEQLVGQGALLRETGDPGPKGGRPSVRHRLSPDYVDAHPGLFPADVRTNEQTPPDLGNGPPAEVCSYEQTSPEASNARLEEVCSFVRTPNGEVSTPGVNGHAVGIAGVVIAPEPAAPLPEACGLCGAELHAYTADGHVRCEPHEHVVYVASDEALQRELPGLLAAPALGLDVETTGLDPRTDRLRLVQLAAEGEGDLPPRTVLVDTFAVDVHALAPLLGAAEGPRLVGHNLSFDLQFLAAAGLPLPGGGRLFDTMLAAQVGDCGEHLHTKGWFTLEALARRALKVDLDKTEQAGAWGTPALTPAQLRYAAADAEVLLPLAARLDTGLVKAGLRQVAQLEFDALPAVAWLELQGAPFDPARWEALAAEAEAELPVCREAVAAHARSLGEGWLDVVKPYTEAQRAPTKTGKPRKLPERTFNPESHEQQLRLLQALGVGVEDVQEATLVGHRQAHPVVDALLTLKDVAKRATAFGRKYLAHVHPQTGRIHARYAQLGSEAGRMSCRGPNLQQVPHDPRYRAAFRAPEGRKLIKADYSQIELCVVAELSGDAKLLGVLNAEGLEGDLHCQTAGALYRVPLEAVTREQRAVAKNVNFGSLYGQGAAGLVRQVGAQGITLSVGQARAFLTTFSKAWPQLTRWRREQMGDTAPAVQTAAGRRRKLPADAPGTYRLNTPVQGTAADGFKAALAELWATRERCPSGAPVLAVHDELVVEADAADADAAVAWVTESMVAGMRRYITRAPVRVEASVSPAWGGAGEP